MPPRWPPRLVALTPASVTTEDLIALLPRLEGLVDALHLRRPGWTARARLRELRRLAAVEAAVVLLVNDRVDLALAAGAGVHLRDDGLPPGRLRGSLRPAWVGASRHDEAGLRRARGADYCTVSPVWPTSSKPGASPLGLEGLRRLAAASEAPVLALGGVTPERVEPARRAGAHGVAVLSGLLGAPDPLARARAYAQALSETERA